MAVDLSQLHSFGDSVGANARLTVERGKQPSNCFVTRYASHLVLEMALKNHGAVAAASALQYTTLHFRTTVTHPIS